MKKLIALLLVAIMALGLVACGGEEAGAPAAAGDDTFKVAIVLAEYNEWNKNYEKKVIEKCEAWGWEYQIFDAKQDANKQIDDVRSVINQGFDAMTIQAVDMAALAPVVEEAADAGVIVVDHYGFTEEQVPGDKIYQNLFDQKGAGKLQAEEFIKINGETGKVAIIAGLTGASNAMARTEGFMEVLNKYPGIEVVQTEYCDWDTQKAQTAAENILTAHPDLCAFLVQDDGMSKGVWNAIEAAGKQETCKIASQGFYGYSIEYIESDKFMFTIAYPAGNFSIAAMDMIKNHVDGTAQERVSYVGMSLVTKDNCRTTDHD
jgi:ABC-type sugar transport system substrate-binding protein